VNPQFHDEFVALCALFYSGEISEEEWALLQIHMGYCDSCQERFLQYERITSDVIPAIAAVAASNGELRRESSRSVDAAERRLMSRLEDSSRSPELPRGSSGKRFTRPLVAACGLVLGCLLGFGLAHLEIHFQAKPTQTLSPQQPAHATGGESTPELQLALRRSEEQVDSLEKQVIASDGRAKQASLAMAAVERQLASEQSAHKQLSVEKDTLSRQLAAAQTELDSMRSQWASTGRDATQQAAYAAALESKVQELKASLDEKDVAINEKDQMLAIDKDFLAHDRDIRDLIGARNLYIAGIFDTTESGKTSKQFGRIFYTKDRSLIFYGFDLDSQGGRRRDVSFQAWGSGGDRSTPVSLGLFYQDDTHKRWVLRCNDAKTLARLDMVFVTVEPPGGSTQPTGKQLLRAYLQIDPNHP